MTLGVSDLREIQQEDGFAEVVCHYCGDKYHFSDEDLLAIITEIEGQ